MATSKADEYLAKALECEKRAERDGRQLYQAAADRDCAKWRAMAAYEDKFAR